MTEKEMEREVQRRLVIFNHAEEVTGNVAMTCRYYGISRQTFYDWKKRYEELGEEGLRPRSKRPKVSPNATHTEVIGKILYLRQNYPSASQDIDVPAALSRRDDLPFGGVAHPQAPRHEPAPDIAAPQTARQPLAALREATPCHQVQIDVKFVAPIKGSPAKKYYQFTAIDDCTRLRVLRSYPRLNQKTAIQFADYVLEKLPFVVQVIQTDNGSEFGPSFHYHLLDKGVGHKYIKPRTPRLNGKVERSHRIDAEEFHRLLDGAIIDDPRSSTTSSKSGRTTTTTIGPTAALEAKPPTSD